MLSGDFESKRSKLVGKNVELFHTCKLVTCNNHILMTLDVFPVNAERESLYDGDNADDNVIICSKSITRELTGGSSVESLLKSL